MQERDTCGEPETTPGVPDAQAQCGQCSGPHELVQCAQIKMSAQQRPFATNNSGASAPKEEEDHSVLQQPITLGVQGVRQIVQCMSNGSREVKDVLLNECSVLFECKVCRSLFRSLANLLAHKRVYCTRHLCEAMPLCALSAPSEEPTTGGELQLTTIAGNTNAVYQRVAREQQQDKGPSSSMATSSRTSYLSARSDCDLTRLACLNCDTTYTSVKTLYLHMVSLHSTTRRYYPCPLCRASFVQMWGVTRHLVSVHGQTKEQIVQLRDSIRGGVQLRKSRLQHMRVSPAMERKILAIIDYDRLACLRCERLFSSFSSLRRHAAVHLGYSRYQCTRCSYQSYNRADCRSHVQRVHADAAHDAERMIVHVPGEEEGGHPMATRFPRLDSLSTLVTRSGAYPKRPPPLGPQK
ncbi:hypothetical protein MTO96_030581 [Rhipicephalus appendiculatus]